MPTRVTPLPKTGATGGWTAAAGGGGGVGGAKYGKTKSAKQLSSRFKAATRDITAARGKGTVPALIFNTCVGVGLIVLGIVLVYLGDENYIVDIMVLGGLCMVMGSGSLVVGCLFILVPFYRERREQERQRAKEASQTQAPAQGASAKPRPSVGQFTSIQSVSYRSTPAQQVPAPTSQALPEAGAPHTQAAAVLATLGQVGDDVDNSDGVDERGYVEPDLTSDEEAVTGASSSLPEERELYDWNTLRAAHSVSGRLAPPTPPPPVSLPDNDRAGTTSTVLTTTEAEPDDVFALGEGSVTPR